MSEGLGADLEVLANPRSSAKAVRGAMIGIETAIFDQGCAGPATVRAVPSLIEILAAKKPAATAEARIAIMKLLGEMIGDSEDYVLDRFTGRNKLATAITKGAKLYLAMLDDRDVVLRALAGRLAAFLPRAGAGIARRLGKERDPRVVATLVLAAASQRRTVEFSEHLASRDARVRAATVIAIVALDRKAIRRPEIVAALFAALDDASLDALEPIPTFHGHLRYQAADTLRRTGHGSDDVIEQLLARRASADPVKAEIPTKVGNLAILALADIAVPTAGKIDGETGKRIIMQMLDVNPGWALGHRGLDGDPLALRRLLGIEEEAQPSRLGELVTVGGKRQPVVDVCLAVAMSEAPYDPSAVLAALGRDLDADTHVTVAIELLSRRDGASRHWDFSVQRRTDKSRYLAVDCERRRARASDLCLQLLIADGPAVAARLDREVRRLEQLAVGAMGALSPNEVRLRYETPLAVLAVVRAVLHARAGEPIPAALHRGIELAASWVFAARYMRELVPLLDAALLESFGRELWWYADAHPAAMRALTAWAKACHNKNGVPPPAMAWARIVAAVDGRELVPVMGEVVKADPRNARHDLTTWTAPDGELVSHQVGRAVSELERRLGA